MTDKKVKSEVNGNVINPIVAAVAGAVVAGVTVAGAMLMSDKKNQAKVNQVASNIKDDLKNTKSAIVNKAKKLGNIANNTVNDVKNLNKI